MLFLDSQCCVQSLSKYLLFVLFSSAKEKVNINVSVFFSIPEQKCLSVWGNEDLQAEGETRH